MLSPLSIRSACQSVRAWSTRLWPFRQTEARLCLPLATGAVTSAPLVSASMAGPANALTTRVSAGNGTSLSVTSAPFELAITDARGHVVVSTVAGRSGLPLAPPAVDGPEPVDLLGAVGGFPALGWVVGVAPGVLNPAPPFTGNRLLGAQAGAIVSVTGVAAITRGANGALH